MNIVDLIPRQRRQLVGVVESIAGASVEVAVFDGTLTAYCTNHTMSSATGGVSVGAVVFLTPWASTYQVSGVLSAPPAAATTPMRTFALAPAVSPDPYSGPLGTAFGPDLIPAMAYADGAAPGSAPDGWDVTDAVPAAADDGLQLEVQPGVVGTLTSLAPLMVDPGAHVLSAELVGDVDGCTISAGLVTGPTADALRTTSEPITGAAGGEVAALVTVPDGHSFARPYLAVTAPPDRACTGTVTALSLVRRIA